MRTDKRDDHGLTAIDGGRPSPLETALRWAKQGYLVVPIAYKEKRPSCANWQKMRLKTEDLPNHFGVVPQNVGLLLGEPDGITDVDLDSTEALSIFRKFMPATSCAFGHASKPASHFLYCCDPPAVSMKFTDPLDKTCLLELRGLGADGLIGRQTVVPGSVHHSGELVQFEPGLDGEPSKVDHDTLVLAVKRTAAAAVLARHYPSSGRHETELAISGVLARAGWAVEDAKQFVLAVYMAVPSHDRNAIGRVAQAVEDTYRKHGEGAETTGIPKLASLIDKRAVDTVLEWLGIGGESSAEITSANWKEHLIYGRSGPRACLENAVLSLHDATWEGMFRFNESAVKIEIHKTPAWDQTASLPRELTDPDVYNVATWMQRKSIFVTDDVAGKAVVVQARKNNYHPIREYFEGLKWDLVERIDTWVPTYLGAEISEYAHAVGSRFLIGAVARVLKPGTKMDTCIVLEGAQGIGKSTALRILADPWFTDQLSDPGSKDSKMEVHGVLIVELSELDALSKSDVARVKAFMTAQEDRLRLPYGKNVINAPRESVFAGSVNPVSYAGYLRDETGNRRFWPIACAIAGPIQLDNLRRDKDQLWAEAVVRFKAGSQWWMSEPGLIAAAEGQQEERMDRDVWEEQITDWIADRESVSIAEVLQDCIKKPAERCTQPDRNRVGKALRQLGWTYRKLGSRGKRQGRFYPPED